MNPSSLSSPKAISTQPQFVMALAIGLMAMVFWIDLQTPLGVAGGVPYVAVVLLTLWLPSFNTTVVFAAVCSGLTLVAYWWSPPGGEMWQVVTNRSLALIAIWTTALFSLQYKKYRLHVEAEGLAFRSMMDFMPHVVFARNGEGNIIAMNEASRVFMKHNGAASSGTRYGLYATQEEEAQARDYEARLFHQSASVHQRKETLVDAQGQRRLYEVSRFPFVWPDTGEKVLCAVAVDETQCQTELEGLRLMEQVVDTSLDHIAVIGPDYRYRRVNATFQRDHRVEGQHLSGLHVKDLRGEETFSRILRPQIDRCLAGEMFTQEDWVSLGAKGRRYMSVSYVPLRNAGIGVDGVVTISRDLTDHKNAEIENQTLRYAFDQAMEGMALYNTQGDFTYVNPAQAAIYGYEVEELVGKSWRVLYDADQIQYIENQCLPLLDKEEQWRGELIGKRKNGESFDVEVSLRQLRSEGGIPAGLLCTCRDISERKLAERALHNSEYRYRSVVETAGSVIVGLDLEGNITDWNREAERLYGEPREEVFGKKYVELFLHEEERSAVEADIEKVLSGNPTRDFENSIRVKSGASRTLVWNVDRLVDGTNSPFGLIAIGRDITERKMAEAALEESRKRFQAIFENAGIGIVVVDVDGRTVETNRAFQAFVGYAPEELKEMSFVDFTHAEDVPLNVRYFQELKAGLRDSYIMPKRYIRKDGEVVRGNLTVTPIWRANGEFEYAIAMIEDVTATMESQEIINKWATIFQHTQWGVAVSRGDDTRFELVNEAFARMHGYAVKELEGCPIAHVYAQEWKRQIPKIIQELHQRGHYSFECSHLRKDGTTFPALVTVSAIKDLLGRVLYRVANVIDISESKQAEAALRESEERFRQFADYTEDGIWLTDWVNHQVLYVNPAYEKLLGGSAQAFYQHSMEWARLIHPEDRSRVVENFMNIVVLGHFDQEYRVVRADGSIRWIRDRGFLIHDADGVPYRVGGCAKDITVQKTMEETIRRYNEELENEVRRRAERIQELEQRRMQVEKLAALAQVAAGVAHEINNPLANIGQSLEVLKRAIPVTHPRYKYFGKISESVDRMAHIVRQLYQLYRPDTKTFGPVQIHEVLRMSIEIMKDVARSQGVILVANVPDRLPIAKIPRTSVTQILCNIIQNALDASQHNDIVEIGVEEQADAVTIWVADHGPGISDEVAPHIFDPFFTTKDGTSTQGGLGLAVSHRLIESCGGSIDFSTTLGQGTTFRITIPLDENIL